MQLYLAGHLGWYDHQKRKSIILTLSHPVLLTDMLNQLQVPIAEIAIGIINGQSHFSLVDVMVQDSDKVELYPPVDGG